MASEATDQVTTIGIDIGKNSFHLIRLDGAGNIVDLFENEMAFSGPMGPDSKSVSLG